MARQHSELYEERHRAKVKSLAHICNGQKAADRSKKAKVTARLGVFAEARYYISHEGRNVTNRRPW